MPPLYPFVCLLGGMVLFLVMLACLMGQDPDVLAKEPQRNIPQEDLTNAMLDMMYICKYLPSGQIVLRDLTTLMVRKGHRIVAAQESIKILLKHNHLALRNGYLYYFDDRNECLDFKTRTRLNGLKSSLNK